MIWPGVCVCVFVPEDFFLLGTYGKYEGLSFLVTARRKRTNEGLMGFSLIESRTQPPVAAAVAERRGGELTIADAGRSG